MDTVIFVRNTWLLHRATVAAVAILLLLALPKVQARSQRALRESAGADVWIRVNVTILARGSHVSASSGNLDSYLVLLSGPKKLEPVAARLVDYYAGFERGISDEAITSQRQFRVRVTAADYCSIDAKGFVIKRAFDPVAIDKIQGSLPCFIVRQ